MTDIEAVRSLIGMVREQMDKDRLAHPAEQRELLEELLDNLRDLERRLEEDSDPPDGTETAERSQLTMEIATQLMKFWARGDLGRLVHEFHELI